MFRIVQTLSSQRVNQEDCFLSFFRSHLKKLTRSESSVKLIDVLSSQLLGYLTNFLSDNFQF